MMQSAWNVLRQSRISGTVLFRRSDAIRMERAEAKPVVHAVEGKILDAIRMERAEAKYGILSDNIFYPDAIRMERAEAKSPVCVIC